ARRRAPGRGRPAAPARGQGLRAVGHRGWQAAPGRPLHGGRRGEGQPRGRAARGRGDGRGLRRDARARGGCPVPDRRNVSRLQEGLSAASRGGLNHVPDGGLRGPRKGGLGMGDFVSDVAAIRRRARQHIEKGPVTGGYKADLPRVIEVLNEVLATEIVCVLRYKRHYFTADGINAQPVAQEFLQHANEEQQHADWVAQRIVQLGGSPNLNPEGLAERSHSQYDQKASLLDMIREGLVAELGAASPESDPARFPSEEDRLAYWLNAYNAFTLHAILAEYPITSVWKTRDGQFFQRRRHVAGGRAVSLDDIEHEILRGQFAEPRIHFAINCGSNGCPPMRPAAYEGARLRETLGAAAEQFL